MSCRSPGRRSPLVKRGRCRSPSSHPPGMRCRIYLRRCLAIQLQKIASYTTRKTECETHIEQEAPAYWMYDSGYLIFQGFLEANLKCFWNGSLMEAMKVLEFQGYIAPGVLLITGSPCALEVVRAAWSRNVLKAPNNYVISTVGDVEDCLVEPLLQGQFTPLPEALCWIILDMTASGQAAVIDTICSTLDVAFPDIQKPSKQLVYDTLAKLTAENKLYQTSKGYFVMTPDRMRLNGLTGGKEHKQVLLTPEEAIVRIHGDMETVRDGDITHQAIQTNLADVICGGNSNDKILYPRVMSKLKNGSSTERLERRNSLRFFHGRRSHSLQRSGSLRHISDKAEKMQKQKEPESSDYFSKKNHSSLFSRIFGRSGRLRQSPSPVRRATFAAQFPPSEWFNRRVTHLHSVGTQTTYLAPNSETSKRAYDHGERYSSSYGTPRSVRRPSLSATLPRRALPLERQSSHASVRHTTSSSASVSSAKTVVSNKNRDSPHLAMSSASSGYNSLPRYRTSNKARPLSKSKPSTETPESSITFHVSTNTKNAPPNETTMTINSGNQTKIFLQQNVPTRSLITVEKTPPNGIVIKNQQKQTLDSQNNASSQPNNVSNQQKHSTSQQKPCRPTSLYEPNNAKLNHKFPSSEHVPLEEKSLEPLKFNNLKQTNLINYCSETDLAKNTDKVNNLKNILNDKFRDVEKELENLNLEDVKCKYPDFPSLSDLSLHFTSLAAQKILNGSYNSVDTLVEVNMAAEKKNACDLNVRTDLGVV